jgi:DNA-binding winged helix-turn-helix (wHTH) protein
MNVYDSGNQPCSSGNTQIIQRGIFFMDQKTNTICMEGKLIVLPPCASACLEELIRRYPEPVKYQELVCVSLGVKLAPLESQDYCRWRIERLRKELEPDPDRPRYIRSVPGIGYILQPW